VCRYGKEHIHFVAGVVGAAGAGDGAAGGMGFVGSVCLAAGADEPDMTEEV
jgi:hypothetical protein